LRLDHFSLGRQSRKSAGAPIKLIHRAGQPSQQTRLARLFAGPASSAQRLQARLERPNTTVVLAFFRRSKDQSPGLKAPAIRAFSGG
jgi:hypothetical protein